MTLDELNALPVGSVVFGEDSLGEPFAALRLPDRHGRSWWALTGDEGSWSPERLVGGYGGILRRTA